MSRLVFASEHLKNQRSPHLQPHAAAFKDSKFGPLWIDQDARPERQAHLTDSVSCELLIVGGGFTGLWAALQARERRPDLDIVLIEATEIGDGASGRNGGFLKSSLVHGDNNGEFHFPGEEDLMEELGRQNMREFISSLGKYKIDARYEGTGEIEVNLRPDQNAESEEWVEELREEGRDVVWLDKEAMQSEVHSPTYMGGVWDRQGQDGVIDPAYLCWGLKRVIQELGVRVFEGTPLNRMDRKGDGMEVECDHGRITCQKIVIATNAFRNPVKRARRRVIPVWDHVVATEPLNDEQMKSLGWKGRQGLGDNLNMFHYYRLTHDNRIVWGGGTSVAYRYGSQTHGVGGDSPALFEKNYRDLIETFPQLSGVRITHRWSGIIASTTRFCMTPGTAFDGRVAWSVGYTGLGVGATRFGARVALELLGYDPTDILQLQMVQRESLAWPPEPVRWPAVHFTMKEMARADRNAGRRGLWLKLLDRLNLGFAC
ncbi:MAG: FAD-dependent oxidoreductase [Deltaproteobacteria bacterium]|nr:FAD-dependent oxidoreductase [Deltaproteobacteria bacterium]